MIIAFVVGWVLGSLSLYSYLLLTARGSPFPECMDCRAASCTGCRLLVAGEDDGYRLAA